MPQKIFRTFSLTALALLLFLITIFTQLTSVQAADEFLSSEINGDQSQRVLVQPPKTNPKTGNEDKKMEETVANKSLNDLFGDEQVFPFQP